MCNLLSINNNSFAYELFDRTEQDDKISQFIALLKDPNVQEFLKLFIDNSIATSELQILKRLSKMEGVLGISEPLDDMPTIPQQLQSLKDKVTSLPDDFKHLVEPKIQPTTKTEKRAVALVSKLRQVKKRFLTSAEIVSFLKQLPEDIQITEDMCNPREVKREVLEKATQLFPDIQLNKSKHGRREVRILIS